MANSETMYLLLCEEADIRSRIAGLASRLEIKVRMQAALQFDDAGADSHGDTTAALPVPLKRPMAFMPEALPVPLKRPLHYKPFKAEAAAVDVAAVKEELEDDELRKELQAAVEGATGRCGNEDAELEADEAAVNEDAWLEAADDEADEELQAAGDEDVEPEPDDELPAAVELKLQAAVNEDAELEAAEEDAERKHKAAASGSGSARSRSPRPTRTRVIRVPPPVGSRPSAKARPKLQPGPPKGPPPLYLQLPPWRVPTPVVREWEAAQVETWLEESSW